MTELKKNDFKSFLDDEKRRSDQFLNKIQIYEERFDPEEYSFIKQVWESDLIDGIYEIIDNLLVREQMRSDLRFTIIGDFLFSMYSGELIDPAELILKTTRNSYIYRIKTRCVVNEIFGKSKNRSEYAKLD